MEGDLGVGIRCMTLGLIFSGGLGRDMHLGDFSDISFILEGDQ